MTTPIVKCFLLVHASVRHQRLGLLRTMEYIVMAWQVILIYRTCLYVSM